MRLNFAYQLTYYVEGLKSHDSKAPTCFRLGGSKSWLRHPAFEAYRKFAQKLLMRHQREQATAFVDSALKFNECHVHCELEEPGYHLEQVLYAHCAIRRAQLQSGVL